LVINVNEEGNVNASGQAVTETQTGEGTPAPSATGENQPTGTEGSTGTEEAGNQGTETIEGLKAQVANLNKALSIARKARRNSSAGTQGGNFGDGQGDDVYNHPAYQELALKNAEYELREGAKDILDQYPQIPQYVRKAILKNPRGYVNQGTADVSNALLDIQDYVDEIALDFEGTGATGEAPQKPKNVPIVGNNQQLGNQDKLELEIAEIQKIPLEEWTPEQEKRVNEFLAKNKK